MSQRKTRVVIFDLDGTLLDTIDDITLQLGRALVRSGHRAPVAEEVRRWVGDGARMLVARALDARPDAPGVDDVLARYAIEAEADPSPATRIMPGAIELLDALVARSIVSVVCTNKLSAVARAVLSTAFGSRISGVIAAGDVARLKPDRMPIDASLALVRASAEQAWMVGDGPQDILAARAAGVRSIALRGYGNWDRVVASEPDVVVDSLGEVLPIVAATSPDANASR